MKIVITGGNGYVGRTLTRSLYDTHEVTVLDNVRSGHMRFEQRELSRFRFVRADIRTFGEVQDVLREARPDVVIHLAAIHYIPECEADPEEAIRTNTIGTLNVVRACEPGTRVIRS